MRFVWYPAGLTNAYDVPNINAIAKGVKLTPKLVDSDKATGNMIEAAAALGLY